MKTLITILMLFPLIAFSQPSQKYSYRPAPRSGELTAIAGVVLIALAASPVVHNPQTPIGVSRAMGAVGGAAVCAGVMIDIGGGKGKKRVKMWARR